MSNYLPYDTDPNNANVVRMCPSRNHDAETVREEAEGAALRDAVAHGINPKLVDIMSSKLTPVWLDILNSCAEQEVSIGEVVEAFTAVTASMTGILLGEHVKDSATQHKAFVTSIILHGEMMAAAANSVDPQLITATVAGVYTGSALLTERNPHSAAYTAEYKSTVAAITKTL